MGKSLEPNIDQVDWQATLLAQSYAYGRPPVSARIKAEPEDFRVVEVMDVKPCGEGEHDWLKISKVRCNTEQVAKALARFAGVSNRDVGFSGMKDYFAVTTQWFSVWREKGSTVNWDSFSMPGITIDDTARHTRKIKRGTHSTNHFQILLRDIDGSIDELISRCVAVERQGVPNYFGAQRFGRNVDNMRQAIDFLIHKKKVKSRHLRGILWSSARSWLFNQLVSKRVADGSWVSLYPHEPANLDGSNSVFITSNSDADQQRLQCMDIHATAPLYGQGADKIMADCPELHSMETAYLTTYQTLISALERDRLAYQRRPIRLSVKDFTWQLEDNNLRLSFALGRGQFATSVLRELVIDAGSAA